MDEHSIKQQKKALRDAVNADIAALSAEYIAQSNRGIFDGVTGLLEYKEARTILAFYSVNREPDTLEIIKHALSEGKTVALPVCEKAGIMHAHVIRSLDDVRPAMLGIPAPDKSAPLLKPEELDFILVPALAFDRGGYRLGYGGGYYDRYLPLSPAFRTGIGREQLLRDKVIREAHDARVACLVTDGQTLRFDR